MLHGCRLLVRSYTDVCVRPRPRRERHVERVESGFLPAKNGERYPVVRADRERHSAVGKQPFKGCQCQLPEKADGSAVFGLDFRVPGMVYAAVRRTRSFGGSVTSLDPASVADRPGVIGSFAIPNGVAVVAEDEMVPAMRLPCSLRSPSRCDGGAA
jgi:hypothetical protein